jgi:hypothetical protein
VDVSGLPISPIFKGQEIQKKEQRTTEVNLHNLLFGTLAMSNYLKKHNVPKALFQFSGKKAPTLVDPLVQVHL